MFDNCSDLYSLLSLLTFHFSLLFFSRYFPLVNVFCFLLYSLFLFNILSFLNKILFDFFFFCSLSYSRYSALLLTLCFIGRQECYKEQELSKGSKRMHREKKDKKTLKELLMLFLFLYPSSFPFFSLSKCTIYYSVFIFSSSLYYLRSLTSLIFISL